VPSVHGYVRVGCRILPRRQIRAYRSFLFTKTTGSSSGGGAAAIPPTILFSLIKLISFAWINEQSKRIKSDFARPSISNMYVEMKESSQVSFDMQYKCLVGMQAIEISSLQNRCKSFLYMLTICKLRIFKILIFISFFCIIKTCKILNCFFYRINKKGKV